MEEFWIPFPEIILGRPIDSGAFGTVYRGSYLGPVAVKAIPQPRRRHADADATQVRASPLVHNSHAWMLGCGKP